MIYPTYYKKSISTEPNRDDTILHTANGVNDQLVYDEEVMAELDISYQAEMEELIIMSELLQKHTDMVLHILNKFNSMNPEEIQFKHIEDLTIQHTGIPRTPYLLLNNNRNLETCLIPYRGIVASRCHFEFMSETEIMARNIGDPHQRAVIDLIFYPYTPKRLGRKEKQSEFLTKLFDLESDDSYEFFKLLFSDPDIQQSFLTYRSYVEIVVFGMKNVFDTKLDTETYERTHFLTWVSTKGGGRTHLNEHNNQVLPKLEPHTERHLHLVTALAIAYNSWSAKCFVDETHLSLLRVILRRCFNAQT